MTRKLPIKEIVNRLQQKGVRLGAPASVSDLIVFEQRIAKSLAPFLRDIYLSFDGFETADEDDMFRLWNLKILAEEQEWSFVHEGRKYHAIGDFWLDADFAMACMDDALAPILLHSSRRTISSNIEAFFSDLATGNLRVFLPGQTH